MLHAVGLAGFAFNSWLPLFRKLIPVHLLISALVLLSFHKTWSLAFLVKSLTIAFGGWLVEFVGVQTNVLFGAYQYTDVLGPSLGGVPLMMAINWLMLIYGVTAIVQRLPIMKPLKVVIGGLVMVILDFALEHFAMAHELWIWQIGFVPINNYLAWFIISCLFVWDMIGFRGVAANPIAIPLIILQGSFFYLGWLTNIW